MPSLLMPIHLVTPDTYANTYKRLIDKVLFEFRRISWVFIVTLNEKNCIYSNRAFQLRNNVRSTTQMYFTNTTGRFIWTARKTWFTKENLTRIIYSEQAVSIRIKRELSKQNIDGRQKCVFSSDSTYTVRSS